MCSDSTLPARVARFHSCVAEWGNAEAAKTAGSSAKNIVSSHAVATREGAREKESLRLQLQLQLQLRLPFSLARPRLEEDFALTNSLRENVCCQSTYRSRGLAKG